MVDDDYERRGWVLELCEHEVKKIFGKFDILVIEGEFVTNPDQVFEVAKKL